MVLPRTSPRMILGCMTGTSIDGLDAALVQIEGFGLDVRVEAVKCLSRPFTEFGSKLRYFADQGKMSAKEIAELNLEFSHFHLEALREIKSEFPVDLISIHGQTVYHHPPVSWQFLNPVPIAYGLNTPVVYDLRSADLAHRGQGAPMTPLADFILYRHPRQRRLIINLGGYCNITQIPNWLGSTGGEADLHAWMHSVKGKDICSCNQLLDRIARELYELPFDPEGKNAANGEIIQTAFENLHKLLVRQAESGLSLGTGDELSEWFRELKDYCSPNDILRTATEAIAAVISRRGPVDCRILAGGGVKNKTLVEGIKRNSSVPVYLSDEFDIPSTHREAVCMAVLGSLCWDRIPITLPMVTGVMEKFVSGCWVVP